ncbi:MAG: hypothetical protein DME12_11185 [Candidatus Rokuibacteriota bacterium]|nr:MAG: hypothetical protein DME12_11185 [Candidatus Rokubacteria bacterium]
MIFSPGDSADTVFLVERGKLTVVSGQGKQAVIELLGPGSVFGEMLVGIAVRKIEVVLIEAIRALDK